MNERCELCGARHCRELFKGHDWLHGQPSQTRILCCEECGLVYLWPRSSRPLDTYPEDYAPHHGLDRSAGSSPCTGQRAGLARKAALARRYGSGTLLDIGCGAGDFLAAVAERDNGTFLGTDISQKAVWRTRRRFGLDVWAGSVPGLPLADGSLRVVTMWHVLEHLSDPLAALCDIRRALVAEGVLIVACPMADSWEAKVFGRYWSGYDVPRHQFTFSRQTLPRLLREAAFEPVEVSHAVLGYNSAKISSTFWLQGVPFLREHPGLTRLVAAVTAGLAALTFELLSRVFEDHGAVGVFVAQKCPDGSQGRDGNRSV